ncbi:hypothetical protein PoB_001199500 [Plakobranchus ocellatus]|uniref:Uncharacterized protein n=1 Tax=Plakobranchus ocellatus TaxID=259542 RepID=A0AAV3YQS7_9GAST|nr:hypothetical protein PoB_001199500 [Plakobranchus ocellatus]
MGPNYTVLNTQMARLGKMFGFIISQLTATIGTIEQTWTEAEGKQYRNKVNLRACLEPEKISNASKKSLFTKAEKWHPGFSEHIVVGL